jgi:hypothetical protein
MPPGVAVVDAFKSLLPSFPLTSLYTPRILLSLILDLIRHGKNHIHVRQDDFPSSQAHPAPAADARSERRHQPDVQVQSQPKQQQATKAQPATAKQSQQLREVEKIVREEREAMDKLPTYKGLERFKLVEKKGECVHLNLVHPNRLADRFYPQWSILQRVQSF